MTNFRLFSLGATFDGLPLTAVLRQCGKPMAVPGDNPRLPDTWRANYVSYIYGDCMPEPAPGEDQLEGGCAPPLEVQVWPACERSLALYESEASLNVRRRRGVPSADISKGLGGGATGIEIYSGASTVAILSQDASLIERAAATLQPVSDGYVPADGAPSLEKAVDLPPAPPGAATGSLRCG